MANEWTKEETIVAFNVYCKVPFKNSSKNHPVVMKYAKILGRTPSALNMKIGNFGRLDPNLKAQGIVGLGHGSKMEEIVWNEFAESPEKLAYESEMLIAKFQNKEIIETCEIDLSNLPQGTERALAIRQRINQSFFRSAVLTSYNFCCCISGVRIPELLEACHIADWSKNEKQRLNPTNGLCMNSFFHKSYDKNLVAITPDYEVKISERLVESIESENFKKYLKNTHNSKIKLPDRFLPNKEFLDAHYTEFKNAV